MANFEAAKKLAEAFPGVELSTSYGTPALKVRGRLMVRLKEDMDTLVLRVSADERDRLLVVNPKVFFLTEHYRNHPWVLLRLSAASMSQLKHSIAHAWQESAPKSLLAANAKVSRDDD